MCVIDKTGWDAMEAMPGFELHTADKGGELTTKQKEENWAYGGQTFAKAFNDPSFERGFIRGGKGQRTMSYLNDIAMRRRRKQMRDEYVYVGDTNNPYVNPTTGDATTSWNQGSQASEKYG
tara:strand:+ start:662 stop:1024 length:363 start_codon:yes stop_codon:yes gene_type:complete